MLFSLGGCAYFGADKPIRSAPEAIGTMALPTLKPERGPPTDCRLLGKGLASWYGHELAGNHTANGEKFDPDGVTAAHRTVPFGTILKVTLDSAASGGKGNPDGVYVRVNDRGPFKKSRIIDLSWGAAKKLGMRDTQAVHVYRCS